VFAIAIAAQIMVILDVSVVNVALPSISESMHLSSADYQWMISAYVLVSGGLLLLGGRIADLLNRRRAFLAGVALFTAASLVSGIAQTPLMLILARAAQGAGAALLTPAALSIVMTTYTGRQRQTALAVWGTVGSLGIAAGVLFGGALTSAFGWRAVFFVNVPIGIAVVAATLRAVTTGESKAGALRRLDVPGAATLVAGLLLLVLGIESTRSVGWSAPRTWLALAGAAALLATFARLERRSRDPLVPPSTWRIRSLVSASVVMAGVTGVVVGAIFLCSAYLQTIVGSSAVVAGLCDHPGRDRRIQGHRPGWCPPADPGGPGGHGRGRAAAGRQRRRKFLRPARAARPAVGRRRRRADVRRDLGGRDERRARREVRSGLGPDDDRARDRRRPRRRRAHRGGRRADHPQRSDRRLQRRLHRRRRRASRPVPVHPLRRPRRKAAGKQPLSPPLRRNVMMNNTPRTFVSSTTFRVTGMTCEHCRRAVAQEIGQVPGVNRVDVDLASGTVTVFADRPVDRADIAVAADEAGYALVP
jgi:MFS family permease/copper chaperone CopZ